MKIIKRNQLVILVIGLMLVTAGYLNFMEMQEKEMLQTGGKIADIGDATLVNSGELVDNEDIVWDEANIDNEKNGQQNEQMLENYNENEQGELTINAKETQTDEYFARTKLERDTMYSQMAESYQKMLDSTAVSEEQKAIAQNEITKINSTKSAIMIAENLIKTKGFSDVVILVNDINVNVILDSEQLKQDDIAKVQNIISREMKAQIENIHISVK